MIKFIKGHIQGGKNKFIHEKDIDGNY